MTPAETAKTEAAKQAVGLVFAMAGAVLLILVQRKLAGDVVDDLTDPGGRSQRRMQAAQRAAQRWDDAAMWLFKFGPWRAARAAHRQADRARAVYEAERP